MADLSKFDQAHLLSEERLQLSPDLIHGKSRGDTIIVKNQTHQTYLTITKKQWRLLKRFQSCRKVSEVLPEMISERECPALKEFYELVLKAVRENILSTEAGNGEQRIAVDWRLTMSFEFAQFMGFSFVLFGFFSLLKDGVQIPHTWWEMGGSWVLTCVALSLGYLLAGCVVRGFEWEVYQPEFHWKTIFPHFRMDLSDARMGGRECELSVALMRLSPIFLISGLAAFWMPALEYLLVLGIIYLTLPCCKSATVQMISSLYRGLELSTRHDFVFVQNRFFLTVFNRRIKFVDKKYLLIYSIYCLGWLMTIFLLNCKIFNVNGVDLMKSIISHEQFRFGSLIVLGLIASLIGVTGFFALWILFKNIFSIFRKRWERFKSRPKIPADGTISREEIIKVLKQSSLFGELKTEVIEHIAEVVKPAEYQSRRYVFHEGDAGEGLFIVFSGKVEVVKELPTGRPAKIADLECGDAFGEIALLERVPRTRSVLSMTKSVLLLLSKEDFDNYLLPRVGARKIREILQKREFLNRIELCRNWHPQALQRFAQMSVISTVKSGEPIIHDGHDNMFFYIVYEGSFNVVKKGKILARLQIGDFFGEISLLQNSVSTADVVAREESKSLSLHKTEFLRFISKEFLIGLQFEKISSKRLHRPIFPLKGKSLETVLTR